MGEEGVSQLFVGIRPKCVYAAVNNFVFFYLLRAVQPILGPGLAQGICAGIGVLLISLPIDMLVVRLQSVRSQSFGSYQVLQTIVKEEGFFGLWSGFGAGLSLTLNPGIMMRILA